MHASATSPAETYAYMPCTPRSLYSLRLHLLFVMHASTTSLTETSSFPPCTPNNITLRDFLPRLPSNTNTITKPKQNYSQGFLSLSPCTPQPRLSQRLAPTCHARFNRTTLRDFLPRLPYKPKPRYSQTLASPIAKHVSAILFPDFFPRSSCKPRLRQS